MLNKIRATGGCTEHLWTACDRKAISCNQISESLNTNRPLLSNHCWLDLSDKTRKEALSSNDSKLHKDIVRRTVFLREEKAKAGMKAFHSWCHFYCIDMYLSGGLMKPYQSHISLSMSADDHRINASRCVQTFSANLDASKWVSASDITLCFHCFSKTQLKFAVFKITSSDLTGWHYITSLSGP